MSANDNDLTSLILSPDSDGSHNDTNYGSIEVMEQVVSFPSQMEKYSREIEGQTPESLRED